MKEATQFKKEKQVLPLAVIQGGGYLLTGCLSQTECLDSR